MMQRLLTCLAVGLLATVGFVGCGSGSKVDTTTPRIDEDDSHPDKGPHGGELFELGEEEYHAEFIHDEKAKTITIYILGPAGIKMVPVLAKECTMEVRADGESKSYKLAASPMEGEPEGKTARFVSSDEALLKALMAKDVQAQLQVAIKGEPFTVDLDATDLALSK